MVSDATARRRYDGGAWEAGPAHGDMHGDAQFHFHNPFEVFKEFFGDAATFATGPGFPGDTAAGFTFTFGDGPAAFESSHTSTVFQGTSPRGADVDMRTMSETVGD